LRRKVTARAKRALPKPWPAHLGRDRESQLRAFRAQRDVDHGEKARALVVVHREDAVALEIDAVT
jgi:hypothetical protein